MEDGGWRIEDCNCKVGPQVTIFYPRSSGTSRGGHRRISRLLTRKSRSDSALADAQKIKNAANLPIGKVRGEANKPFANRDGGVAARRAGIG